MQRTKLFRIPVAILALAMFVCLSAGMARAQVVSNTATLALTYTAPESITLSVSPTSLQLSNVLQPVTVSANWNLLSTRTQFAIGAYFSSATAALTGAANLPAGDIQLQGTGTGTNNVAGACNQTWGAGYANGMLTGLGVANASCGTVAYIASIGSATSFSGTVQISTDATIPAGNYSGSLLFIAIAE